VIYANYRPETHKIKDCSSTPGL